MPFLLFTVVAFGLAACAGTPHPDHTVPPIVEQMPGASPRLVRATESTTYTLYAWTDAPDVNAIRRHPITWSTWVDEEHNIGFALDESSALLAVAGSEQRSLPVGRYCWHETPDGGAAFGHSFAVSMAHLGGMIEGAFVTLLIVGAVLVVA